MRWHDAGHVPVAVSIVQQVERAVVCTHLVPRGVGQALASDTMNGTAHGVTDSLDGAPLHRVVREHTVADLELRLCRVIASPPNQRSADHPAVPKLIDKIGDHVAIWP